MLLAPGGNTIPERHRARNDARFKGQGRRDLDAVLARHGLDVEDGERLRDAHEEGIVGDEATRANAPPEAEGVDAWVGFGGVGWCGEEALGHEFVWGRVDGWVVGEGAVVEG